MSDLKEGNVKKGGVNKDASVPRPNTPPVGQGRPSAPPRCLNVEKGTTERGFRLWNFTDRYGQKCSLQMSSLATEAAVWFGVDVNLPKESGGEGKEVHERMHLTQDMIAELLPALQHFAETGELP